MQCWGLEPGQIVFQGNSHICVYPGRKAVNIDGCTYSARGCLVYYPPAEVDWKGLFIPLPTREWNSWIPFVPQHQRNEGLLTKNGLGGLVPLWLVKRLGLVGVYEEPHNGLMVVEFTARPPRELHYKTFLALQLPHAHYALLFARPLT